MEVMVVPIMIGALGMMFKGFGKGLKELKIGGCAETIQTSVIKDG